MIENLIFLIQLPWLILKVGVIIFKNSETNSKIPTIIYL